MTRLAIALCAAAAPALADDCRWGGAPYSTANVAPDGEGGAVITFWNGLTPPNPFDAPCHVPFGEGEIVIEWEHGPGMLPDTGFVTPPEGYIAIPPYVVIEEEDTGTVRIVPFDGVMG
jgi:hypothetical protein